MQTFARKLALGTVQFGVPYGISNTAGQVPAKEVAAILKTASNQGIELLDTAAAYGESEQVLGEEISRASLRFRVVSKLPNVAPGTVQQALAATLEKLRTNTLYGYLVHDVNWFRKHTQLWDELEQLKISMQVQKTGFSVYEPEQLEWLLEKSLIPDLVQLPYNLFDQRFAYLFPELKSRGVEVHARSVFLQGLFFLEPANLRPHFYSIKEKLTQLKSLFAEAEIPVGAGLLCFAWLCEGIDKLVIGVQTEQQLLQNLKAACHLEKTRALYPQLLPFADTDNSILLPTLWK